MIATDGAIDLYPCNELACLEITGQDSVSFLQSQLTQDVQLLSQGRAALTGYCSAQGRLLASMVLVPTDNPQTMLALVRQDLLEGLVKRLRMFVLRSKVVLQVRDDLRVWGLVADAQSEFECPQAIWGVSSVSVGLLVRAPSSGTHQTRCWLISSVASTVGADDQTDSDPRSAAPAIAGSVLHQDAASWNVQDILAGLPWIAEATKDLFIPQTVNLDLIDGVSFSKGCYPGQEVVARAHYRAKVKRRMHVARVSGTAEILPASDVFVGANPDDPVGRVIQVAREEDMTYILFDAPFKVLSEGGLVAGEAAGPVIELQALPYSIEETGG
ncbi:CAF17-like 4Fe-4S cluster assembly/insertion protein YgfZ [Orrella marina]|uniref:Folate-binding protein n=1 Tax=Orrella marina TaxID=2163011 RepID=A0A2R4XHE8_9BURK|nr:folate-binding protein YgfZ [Orrella marina]AWB33237.1 folate-binding protein [Orrella marina]